MNQERLRKAVNSGEYTREMGFGGAMVVDIPLRALWPDPPVAPITFVKDGAAPAGEETARSASLRSGQALDSARQEQVRAADNKSLCTAVRGDGRRCESGAVSGSELCARHKRWYATLPPMMGMPYPEDAVALQDIVAQVLSMVLNQEIDVRRGRVAAQLCQVLQRNLKEYDREVRQAEYERNRWSNRAIGATGQRVI